MWFDVDGVLSPSSTDEKAMTWIDFCASISTKQLNRISNSRGKFLDLVFSNEILFADVSSCEDFTGCTSIYHTPITINIYFHLNCNSLSYSNNCHFNYSNADYAALNDFLSNANWDFLQRGCNLNDTVRSFNALLKSGIASHVPLISRKPAFREPWFNEQLVNLEKRRNKFHNLYRLRGAEFYPAFNLARKEFKRLNWFLYSNYMLQIEEDISSNSRAFWRFINKKRKVSGFPSSMSYQGSVANSPSDVCDLFADFFASVYEPATQSATSILDSHGSSDFSLIKFTEAEVCDCLYQLDVKKGSGYDGIPPIVFKSCAESLATPVTFLFNESIRTGIFPDPWKTSVIYPIFKSGIRSEVENYRGVTNLSVLPKLFEFLVHKILSFHIRPFISQVQHGFYPGRSTVSNLVTFCGDLFGSTNSKLQLDAIYTDFAKAFDKIDHAILIDKLESLGCAFVPIRWVASYLHDRRQFVKITEFISREFTASSGVPQGSHIGPLLFAIFINDVVNCFKFAKCLLFADDMKIFATITNVSDCRLLQSDLDRFCSWSSNNKLVLNINKCKIISYFRIRSPVIYQYCLLNRIIDRVEYISDLGVIFSSDATFNRHIDCITAKAFTMLGFIKRNCKDFHDPLTLKALYVAFVRSILEYASPVWSPFYGCHSERIESVQKQFILYALRRLPHDRVNQYFLPPYQDRCNLLGLQRLNHRRDVASVIFVHDTLNSRVDCADLLSRFNISVAARCLRRREHFLHIGPIPSNHGLSEPVLSMSRLFNSVFQSFDFTISRESFKKALHKLFTAKA